MSFCEGLEQCGVQTYSGRRVLFATDVRDELPHIPGLKERWGRSVHHCPYCHGYELDMGAIGVIATSPMSVHQAEIVAEWGQTTFFPNGAFELDAESARTLASRGVRVEPAAIRSIEGTAEVLLADGRRLAFAGLFTAPRNVPSSSAAADLGCELAETPFGSQIWTEKTKETSIAGAFACGEVARVPTRFRWRSPMVHGLEPSCIDHSSGLTESTPKSASGRLQPE